MTRFWLLMRVALRAIARNKLRSSLTVLGIIIGVAAVIAMVAIGEGASSMVQDQIASLGDNLINIFPGSMRGPGGATAAPAARPASPRTTPWRSSRACPASPRSAPS